MILPIDDIEVWICPCLTLFATCLQAAKGTLDYVVDTISAKHDLEQYLSLLKVDGKYVVVGVPPEPYQLNAGTLIGGKYFSIVYTTR